MEEGSLGGTAGDSRLPKRSRATEESNTETFQQDSSKISMGLEPEVTTTPNPPFGTHSFRDKLMNKVNLTKNVGIEVNCLAADYEDLNDDEDVVVSKKERGPSIQFSKRAMNRLCQPWQNALIIKLLGRAHTYNYLQARLQQKWQLKGNWKLVDLVNDYFVVKFELEEDLNFVLTGGPWIIAGQYLILQKWRPGFNPVSAQITNMAAWIRVSGIQLECFDVWALKRIGNLLGKLLKIDSLTTDQNRGKFARLCVELDLTKPLEAFTQINQVWYNIEYEGLPDICYLCGRYGHKKENCELKATADTVTVGKAPGVIPPGVDDVAMEKSNIDCGTENLRGPWMNVPVRRKPKHVAKDMGNKGTGGGNFGSRFDVLKTVGEGSLIDGVATDVNLGKHNYGHIGTSKNGEANGKKVWTKAKSKPHGPRTALNDISNKLALEPDNRTGGAIFGRQSSNNETGGLVTERTPVNGERRHHFTVNEQSNHWINGENSYKEKGVYVFGHQPPNITTPEMKIGEEHTIEEGINPLASEAHVGLSPSEIVDPNSRHLISPIGDLEPNSFTVVEGMDCGSN